LPDADILPWLQQFEHKRKPDLLAICETAFRCRNDRQMHRIAYLSREPDDGSNRDEIATAFARVRHIIGRLATHVRKPLQLLEDSTRVQSLLDVYTITSVETPPAVALPAPDSHTNLAGILGRLFPETDPRFEQTSRAISRFAEPIGLEAKILSIWNKDTFVPQVHAEVQLLEEFHRAGRVYVANDPYIACSKLACLCCSLYFNHYEVACALPESHQKLYPKWSPPFLPGGTNSPLWIDQRRILNSMIQDIRKAIIARMQVFNADQPDSLAEITQSVENMSDVSSSGSEAGYSNDDDDGDEYDDNDNDDYDDTGHFGQGEKAVGCITL
jgi:hypothetical protein